MFVRCKRRFKDGKEHRYWSVVENVRVRGGRVVQRHVLYLGEINDSQRAAWCRSIEVVEGKSRSRQMALFPEDREAPALTRVMELRVSSRVSRQRLRSRGAPLPSAGSRWPRFPGFDSTMKALRLPTLHPSDLLFSPVSAMCACFVCVVARALPMPHRQVVGPGFGV